MAKIRIDEPFGKNLRRLRKLNGYTQEQIVAKLQITGINISRSMYSQIECGTYNIKISELRALHDIYNVSYDEFFK